MLLLHVELGEGELHHGFHGKIGGRHTQEVEQHGIRYTESGLELSRSTCGGTYSNVCLFRRMWKHGKEKPVCYVYRKTGE